MSHESGYTKDSAYNLAKPDPTLAGLPFGLSYSQSIKHSVEFTDMQQPIQRNTFRALDVAHRYRGPVEVTIFLLAATKVSAAANIAGLGVPSLSVPSTFPALPTLDDIEGGEFVVCRTVRRTLQEQALVPHALLPDLTVDPPSLRITEHAPLLTPTQTIVAAGHRPFPVSFDDVSRVERKAIFREIQQTAIWELRHMVIERLLNRTAPIGGKGKAVVRSLLSKQSLPVEALFYIISQPYLVNAVYEALNEDGHVSPPVSTTGGLLDTMGKVRLRYGFFDAKYKGTEDARAYTENYTFTKSRPDATASAPAPGSFGLARR